MKTPDEIKKGAECCTELFPDDCVGCPYDGSGLISENRDCLTTLIKDQLAYIQQLERERDEMAEDLHGRCEVCAYYNSMSGKCAYCNHNIDAWNVSEDNWEWRGVKEVE